MPTAICVPIAPQDPDTALADAQLACDNGADMIEWRLDELWARVGQTGALRHATRLVSECPLPCIATCRHEREGGGFDGPETDRVELIKTLVGADHPPSYVDLELSSLRDDHGLRDTAERITSADGVRLIASIHDFVGRPQDLDRRLLAAWDDPSVHVVKVAYTARSLRDNLELFDILRSAPKPTIALGMGPFGLMSRVLAPKFNALLTFASLRDEQATAPGQPTLAELVHLYRFRDITRTTHVFGVVGWPVEHSLSPAAHNAAFEATGTDAVYLSLPIAADPESPEASATSFNATIDALRAYDPLELAGASVTIPHKVHAFDWALANGADIGPKARAIGAINTLAFDPAHIRALNTDASAIAGLLRDALGEANSKAVLIVGAGGVARAAARACSSIGAEPTITARSYDKALAFVESIGVGQAIPMDDALAAPAWDAVVNATPVGMSTGPDPDGVPIDVQSLSFSDGAVVLDTVYDPLETPLLRASRARGLRTIDGLAMFVHQAVEQSACWTDRQVPVDLLRRVCEETLEIRRRSSAQE